MIRQKNRALDLTQGGIAKQLTLFVLPILASSLFQQLYTTVDAVIVGQFSGVLGLAAIDSVYSLLKLPVNFLVGLSSGATIILSQMVGGNRREELPRVVHTAIAFSVLGGALFSVLGVVLAPVCLSWMEVPDNLWGMTLDYLRIYFGGLLFSMLYNMEAGILRAMGDSGTPFWILLAAGLSNLALDLLLVGVFSMGVAGAALATVFAQLLSAALALRALTRCQGACRVCLRSVRFHSAALVSILRLGLPVGLQSSLYPIANTMIQASINRSGTENIAAWALCGKLDFLIWLCADSLAIAVSTFVAQNAGAGLLNRVRRGMWTGMGMTLGVVGLLCTILFIWCEQMSKLFIQPQDYGIIPLMAQLMRFLAPFYPVYVVGEILSAVIRGTGETFYPMLLTLAGTCLTRIGWVLLIVPRQNGIEVIISSYPVSWAVTSVAFLLFYALRRRKILAVPCLPRQKEPS